MPTSKTGSSGTQTTKKTTKTTTKAKRGSTSRAKSNGRLVIVESPPKRGRSASTSAAATRCGPRWATSATCRRARSASTSSTTSRRKYLVPRDKTQGRQGPQGERARRPREVYPGDRPRPRGRGDRLAPRRGDGPPGPSRVTASSSTRSRRTRCSAAMAHPREIDMDLVDAQQARRVLDRLVGYTRQPAALEEGRRGLSAGRVQTVAVRMVVEREREIEAFVPVEYWTIEAELAKQPTADGQRADQLPRRPDRVDGKKAELHRPSERGASRSSRDLDGAAYVVATSRKRAAQRRPAAPFTTSTLQQEASRKLGLPPSARWSSPSSSTRASTSAERHVGLITYMRTDSTNVAAARAGEARAVHRRASTAPTSCPRSRRVYTTQGEGRPGGARGDPPDGASTRDPDERQAYLLSRSSSGSTG